MRQRQTYQPKAARSERKASVAAAALSGDEGVRGGIRNNGAQQRARLQERGSGGWRGETFGCGGKGCTTLTRRKEPGTFGPGAEAGAWQGRGRRRNLQPFLQREKEARNVIRIHDSITTAASILIIIIIRTSSSRSS